MLARTAAAVVSTAARSLLTASEFFAWEGEQLDKHELCYGEAFSMAGGTVEHARLTAKVTVQLANRIGGGDGDVYSSELAVEIDAAGHFAYPDATVVCGPVERSEHGPAVTNPTVVVEVLSPSTAPWDRGGKLDRYRRLPSLQAVVFVSTDRARADAVVRDGDRWVLVDPDADGRLALDAVGASLDVPALFEGVASGPESPVRSRS